MNGQLEKQNRELQQRIENLTAHLDASAEALIDALLKIKHLEEQVYRLKEERKKSLLPAPQGASLQYQEVDDEE